MKRKVAPLAILLVFGLIMGCATTPQTPASVYYNARVTYNDLLESYVVAWQQAPAESQEQWNKDITPWFQKASVTLDTWSLALQNNEDPTVQADAYIKLKNEIVSILLSRGIL